MKAFLRDVSPNLDRREHPDYLGKPIKVARARKQHEAFAAALRELGASVEFFAAAPEQPDGVFVADTAVLLPEVAVVARPGPALRLTELGTVAPILAQYRPVQRIVEPGNLHGADVLCIGQTLFVARTRQTSAEGIAGLREIVEPFGYEVRPVEIGDGFHLKNACTFIPPQFLLVNPGWVQTAVFGHIGLIAVDETEPFAANTLSLGGATLVSESRPKTQERLKQAGIQTRAMDISEFEKAGAGLASLSLILEPRPVKSAIEILRPRTIETPGAPASAGHSSQAIVHAGLVYVSAQPPMEFASDREERMSVEEQTERALRDVAVILTAAGSSLSLVLRATVLLADQSLLGRIEPVYARTFAGHRPTRTVIVNKALPQALEVQIEVVAAIAVQSL